MPTQRHAHVVNLHGDGIVTEQTFVQQFDLRALDEAQLQQAALQLHGLVLVMAMGAHLDDDAAIAASGLAQLYGVGQNLRSHGRGRSPAAPRFFDSDYQVRTPRVQRDSLTNCRAGALRYQTLEQEPSMSRLVLAAPLLLAPILGLTACGQDAPSTPAMTPAKPVHVLTEAEKASLLAALPAPYNAGDLENGRRAFARCRSCHTIGEGGADMAGPNLYGVFGRKAGERPRYNYSNAMRTANFTWDADKLDHWLQNPRGFLPGNKMTFPGLPDAKDRRDVIAFLKVETGYKPEPAPAS